GGHEGRAESPLSRRETGSRGEDPGEHRAPRAIQRRHGEVVCVDQVQREPAARVGSERERREGDERLGVIERARHEFGRRAGTVHARAEEPPALLLESDDALTLHGRMISASVHSRRRLSNSGLNRRVPETSAGPSKLPANRMAKRHVPASVRNMPRAGATLASALCATDTCADRATRWPPCPASVDAAAVLTSGSMPAAA